MSENTVNKRIAKNTILLYIREIASLLIALYSSRILLQQLGVNDFGLYGLIGSILLLFNSLRGLFASSIQRFINVEKGLGNESNVNKVFSLGVTIHIGLSVIFFIVSEIAGLILIPTLNIPAESITTAQWVLQFSILASIVTIMTVPYDAIIIANEKFDALAVLSISESILKLAAALLLIFSPWIKVVTYSALLFVVSVIIRTANAIYCSHKFKDETRFRFIKDKSYLKKMTIFAGWHFLGNTVYAFVNAGMNFIINIFGGVVVNAARNIAYQVLNAVQKFVTSVNLSFQPQSMMLYSQGNKDKYYAIMFINTKVSVAICAILGFVVAVMCPSLLKLWLCDVPNYSIEFVQAIFLYATIRSVHSPIDTMFKASGVLKKYQILEMSVQVLNIPISLFILYVGMPYYSIFISMSIVEIVNLFVILHLAKVQFHFDTFNYGQKVLLRVILLMAVLGGTFFLSVDIMNISYSFISTLLKSLICFIYAMLLTIFTLFPADELKRLFQLKNKKH